MVNIATAHELSEEFSYYLITLEDPIMLQKLIEMCISYNIDAKLLVAEWMAYSCTNHTDSTLINNKTLHIFQSSLSGKNFHLKSSEISSVDKRMSCQSSFLDKSFLSDYGDFNTSFNEPKSINQETIVGGKPHLIFKYTGGKTQSGDVVPPSSRVNIVPVLLIGPKKMMFERTIDISKAINRRINYFDNLYCEYHKIETLSHVALSSQEKIYVGGMLVSESEKPSIQSLQLQGSLETSCGLRISLDFEYCEGKYSLFAGKNVVFSGQNITGNVFKVENVLNPPPLPFFVAGTEFGVNGLRIVAAYGPFSSESEFEPLSMLLSRIRGLETGVDVIFLMGPFVDLTVKSLVLSYDEIFCALLNTLGDFLDSFGGEIVMVPSENDIFHLPVFPQSPFDFPGHKRLHFVSNPTVLRIGGISISATSSDCLISLSGGEVSNCVGGDRIARLLGHLLGQRSLQPIYPIPGSGVHVVYSGRTPSPLLENKPHVMFVGSDLRHFIKDVDGCLCVNPGRVGKGSASFSYICLVTGDKVVKANDSGVSVIRAEILSIS